MSNNNSMLLANSNSCMKASDNKHFDCPARMADGRHFTDYRPNCHLNNNLRTNNMLENTFDYRRFLQRRGHEMMELNRSSAYEQNGCGTCKEPYHENTMLPEQTRLYCDKNGCKATVVDPNGLGQGRIYSDDSTCDNVGSPEYEKNGCAKPEDNLRHYGYPMYYFY